MEHLKQKFFFEIISVISVNLFLIFLIFFKTGIIADFEKKKKTRQCVQLSKLVF